MKKNHILLALFFASLAAFDAVAQVELRNKDNTFYDLDLSCDGLHRGLQIAPLETLVFGLGATDPDQADCRLTVTKTYNSLDMDDGRSYIIDDGDLFKK